MDPLFDTVDEGDELGGGPDAVPIAKEHDDPTDDGDLHRQVAAAIDDLDVPADSTTGPLVDVPSSSDGGQLQEDLFSPDLPAASGPLVAIATDGDTNNPDPSNDELRALVASSKPKLHTAADDGAGGKPTTLRIDLAASPNDGIFPVGLLCDILLHVPAKAICRFRCVSTSWRSLLRHPNFVAAHMARHPPTPLIAATVRLERSDGMVMGVNLLDASGNVVKKIRSHAAVTGCSLYGMCAHRELACLVGTDRRLRVIDMATGAVAAFPPRPRGALTCTLGRVPLTGEYKVLTIVTKTRRSWGQVWHEQVGMVLTLGSNGGGRWREVESPPPVMVHRRHRDVAAVKGVVYFSMESCLHLHEQRAHVIVAFDLETEEWLPPFYGPWAEDAPLDHRDRSLAEVNDFLVAAHHHGHAVQLWFLMESTTNHKWCPLYTIAMPDQLGSSRFRFEKPLQVLDDGRIVVWSSATDGSHDGMPQIYDPKTDTLTEGAVTPNCYAVGPWTGCLQRVGGSDPRSHKTLELLDDEESSRWDALGTVEYGSDEALPNWLGNALQLVSC